VASAFLYLVSALAIGYGAAVVVTRAGWLALGVALLLFGVVAWLMYNVTAFELGRPLAVDHILNAADAEPAFRALPRPGPDGEPGQTGDAVRALVRNNTVVGLLAVGLILSALYCLAVRATPEHLTKASLRARLFGMRLALVLASAILVAGTLASRTLLEWPSSLLTLPQQEALKPLTNALMLQWGAASTIALIAAFAPAVAALTLDVEAYRALPKEAPPPAPSMGHMTISWGAVEPSGAGTPAGRTPPSAKADDDGLTFAPIPTVVSLLAVLAPLLASPFVDALKAVAGALLSK
jgi:hypothetical protein